MSRRGARRLALASCLVLALPLQGCGERGFTVADPSTSGPGAGSEPTEEDFDAVQELLDRRAATLLQGDRAGFLATLDPGNTALREQQLVAFDNLQALPVQSVAYEADDFGLDAADVPGDDPVLRPGVEELVRLKGPDSVPVVNTVQVTFVERDGVWLVGHEAASDDEDAYDSVQSRPWFGVRLDVAVRGPLIVVTDKGAHRAAPLADRVRRDLGEISDLLDVRKREALLVDATSTGLAHEMNGEGDEASAVAFAVGGRDADGVGQLAGWRIKIHPDQIDELLDDDQLMRHELTHVVVNQLSDVMPTWLSEGIAEYVGWYPDTPSDLSVPAAYKRMLLRAEREIPTSGVFSDDPDVTYMVAHAAVAELVRRKGVAALLRFLRSYAEKTDDPWGDSYTDQLLRAEYGIGEDQLATATWGALEELHTH